MTHCPSRSVCCLPPSQMHFEESQPELSSPLSSLSHFPCQTHCRHLSLLSCFGVIGTRLVCLSLIESTGVNSSREQRRRGWSSWCQRVKGLGTTFNLLLESSWVLPPPPLCACMWHEDYAKEAGMSLIIITLTCCSNIPVNVSRAALGGTSYVCYHGVFIMLW